MVNHVAQAEHFAYPAVHTRQRRARGFGPFELEEREGDRREHDATGCVQPA